METTLRYADIDTLSRLAMKAECRDGHIAGHMIRTGVFSTFLGTRVGLPRDTIHGLRHSAPMHDLGNIGIPESILRKPAGLTREEFEVVKTHTTIGARILDNSEHIILQMARQIALTHHERWDGQGYPNGLSGEDIPLTGRIVGLVDAFDAMMSVRPYRDAMSVAKTCEIIEDEKGKQFDPGLVEVFFDNLDHLLDVHAKIQAPACSANALCAAGGAHRSCANRDESAGTLRLIKGFKL